MSIAVVMATPNWRDEFIADMEAIGLLVHDVCLGCHKQNCTSCPAGTSTMVMHDKLSPEASAKLREVFLRKGVVGG